MGEIDLKKAIQEKVEQEKEAILNQARQEEENILKAAKEEADALAQADLKQVNKACELKKARDLNQLVSQARKDLLQAKEEKILEVFSQVKENLKRLHQDTDEYKPIFRRFLQEALGALDKMTKLKLKVSPGDEEVGLKVSKDLRLEVSLETEGSLEDGFVLLDSEEKRIILNTFASRLHKLMPGLRQEVSKILFGGN